MPHASTKRLLQTQPLQTKYLSGLLGKVLRKELQKSGEDIRKYQQLVEDIPALRPSFELSSYRYHCCGLQTNLN